MKFEKILWIIGIIILVVSIAGNFYFDIVKEPALNINYTLVTNETELEDLAIKISELENKIIELELQINETNEYLLNETNVTKELPVETQTNFNFGIPELEFENKNDTLF